MQKPTYDDLPRPSDELPQEQCAEVVLVPVDDHQKKPPSIMMQSVSDIEICRDSKAVSPVDGIVPGKFINLVGRNSNFLKTVVKIGKSELNAIIDSGAERSFISSKAVDDIGIAIDDTYDTFKAIGQSNFSISGKVNVCIHIGNYIMHQMDVMVLPITNSSEYDVILGLDFLKLNKIEIMVKDRILMKNCIDGSFNEIYLDKCGKVTGSNFGNIPCFTSTNVNMIRGNLYKVPVNFNIPCVSNDCKIMYSESKIEPCIADDIRGYSGLSRINNAFIYMCTSEKDVTLKKGTRVGSIDKVLEVDSDEDCNNSNNADSNWENEVKLDSLPPEKHRSVMDMLASCSDVFSSGSSDIGHACVTSHKIRLSDSTPIYQRPRRLPQPINDEIERQCKELTEADIIEPSVSPWSSPIVPVRKKDGTIRMCIDYRRLNNATIPEKFPVPNLGDSIFGLHGTKYFTKLDLIRGYYQIPIDKESREYTAFTTSRNHWQFKRLSFGLKNAPSAFQRQIQAVLSAFPSNRVVAYIDDILIMSSTFDEHLELVGKVLKTLENYHIKLKPSKCEWFKTEVEFLGHIVSATGIRKTRQYIDRVRDYPRPETVGALREFLGFINFQRKYIPNCSVIQKPLSELTGGKKSKRLNWTEAMVNAFESLKSEMLSEIELAYPDYSGKSGKLELWVDASSGGAGAYLAQQQGDSHRVIGFASMSFSSTQLNYSTLERELTALRWGIKTFRPFLYGIEFILYTDHQPLTHLHNMKLICSRLARTVQELADYVFEIRYTPGHLNCAADALSRINLNRPELGDLTSKCTVPSGLMLDGSPAPGGGDSLFYSLLTVLTTLGIDRLPTVDGLRIRLVSDLVDHPSRYKLKLDRESRKQLKLMQLPGQVPALEVLLAASFIFKVKVYVYFWGDEPIIYQYDNDLQRVVHLQCISGIHFNPLIEVRNYSPPDPQHCVVNSVCIVDSADCIKETSLNDSVDEDDQVEMCDEMMFKDVYYCNHSLNCQPIIRVQIFKFEPCALLDTGSEISLVTESTVKLISSITTVDVRDERFCDIISFSGEKYAITKVIELKFNVGNYSMSSCHKFAVVSDHILPCCFILGLDYLTKYDISMDFNSSICKVDRNSIVPLYNNSVDNVKCCYMIKQASVNQNHQLIPQLINDDLRFELTGDSGVISGLSLVSETETIRQLQGRCRDLSRLRTMLSQGIISKNWPGCLSSFRRYVNVLKVVDGVVVFGESNVVVVPFKLVVELALSVHYNFAHIGRDKLIHLLSLLIWHPSQTKVISDVCTTCHDCQVFKDFSTPLRPPTLKIVSSYPFELVAVDIMSLPSTSTGNVAVLMVVDHFSKFVAAVPLKNKQSRSVVNALSRQVLPFLPSIPTNMLTDNGPEFVSGEFDEFLMSCGINHKLTTPYCPTSNGCVERVNRTIQNFIKVLVSNQSNWDDYLGKAVITYNNTLHVELSMSPSKFLITKSHAFSDDPPLQGCLQERWKLGHPKFLPFRIGDSVLMRVQHKGFANNNKFLPKYSGPYRVTKVNSNGVTYEISSDEIDKILRVHHSKLRFYKNPPRYILDHHMYKKHVEQLEDNDVVRDVVQLNKVDATFSASSDSFSDSSSDVSLDSDSDPNVCSLISSDSSLSTTSIDDIEFEDSVSIEASVESDVNDFSISPCPGCAYECSIEESLSEVDFSLESIASPRSFAEVLQACSVTSPLLDWDFSLDESDFSLPSIKSDKKIDHSHESIEQEPQTAISNESELEYDFIGFNVDDVSELFNDQESSFTGFDDNPHCGKQVKLRSLISDNVKVNHSSSIVERMHTRSQGTTMELPNVQSRILERKYRKNPSNLN